MKDKMLPGSFERTFHGNTNCSNNWSKIHSNKFNVRAGKDYKKNGLKKCSDRALYEVVAVDAFKLKSVHSHFGRFLDLKALETKILAGNDASREFIADGQDCDDYDYDYDDADGVDGDDADEDSIDDHRGGRGGRGDGGNEVLAMGGVGGDSDGDGGREGDGGDETGDEGQDDGRKDGLRKSILLKNKSVPFIAQSSKVEDAAPLHKLLSMDDMRERDLAVARPHVDEEGLPLPNWLLVATVAQFGRKNCVVIGYGRLRRHVVAEAAKNADPAVKLVKDFVHNQASPFSVKEDLRKRFKVIAKALNLQDFSLPSFAGRMLKKYNGKPFLARTSSSFFSGEDYFEVDIDSNKFSYLSQLGLKSIVNYLPYFKFGFAYVVQAEADEEMPERLVMCYKMLCINIEQFKKWPY